MNSDRSTQAPLPGNLPWPLWAFAVLFLATLLLFSGLGAMPLWQQEGRRAEVVREMRLSGNYFWPTVNGQAYLGKPLLAYWMMASAAHLLDGLNEFTARLPGAISGWLGVALILLLARRLYDDATGILAGIILATSYSYVYYARHISPDIETLTGILAALALFVHKQDRQAGWWIVGLWSIMAATSLAKGLMGFALPLLVIGIYSLVTDGWRDVLNGRAGGGLRHSWRWFVGKSHWLLNGKTPLAVVVALAVYCAPFIAAAILMDSNAALLRVWRENVTRFLDPFDHEGAIYLYAYAIFMLMAPWSAFLPAALIQMHGKSKNKSDRFTLVYFWATFIFFTLSGSRRGYYLLPILPAASIIVARLLVAGREEVRNHTRTLMKLGYGAIALIAVIAGALAFLPPSMRPGALSGLPPLPHPLIYGVIWLSISLSVFYVLAGRQSTARIACSTTIIAYLGLLYLHVFALPGLQYFSEEKNFAQEVGAEIQGEYEHLALYKLWAPGLLFYLNAPESIAAPKDQAALLRFIENNPKVRIIALERVLARLQLPGSAITKSRKYVLFRPDPPARSAKAQLQSKR